MWFVPGVYIKIPNKPLLTHCGSGFNIQCSGALVAFLGQQFSAPRQSPVSVRALHRRLPSYSSCPEDLRTCIRPFYEYTTEVRSCGAPDGTWLPGRAVHCGERGLLPGVVHGVALPVSEVSRRNRTVTPALRSLAPKHVKSPEVISGRPDST